MAEPTDALQADPVITFLLYNVGVCKTLLTSDMMVRHDLGAVQVMLENISPAFLADLAPLRAATGLD